MVATHDVEWIEKNCFDLIVLSNGRNLANGEPRFYREEADYLNLRKDYKSYSVSYHTQDQKQEILDYLRAWPEHIDINPVSDGLSVNFRAVR